MAKEQRGAVVSVRITEDEQARLREVAQARGTSVSEFMRSVVIREVDPPARTGGTMTTTLMSRPAEVGRGIFWADDADEVSVPTPGTLIMRS